MAGPDVGSALGMGRAVVIASYDPRWPELYEREKGRILRAVGSRFVAIEHVGSTAVPGLAGKAILDILGGVERLREAEASIPSLEEIGYVYVPEYEDELPQRRYFRKGPPEARTHHLHVVEVASEFWEEQVLFRDYLRAHQGSASEYEALKRDLAAIHGADRVAYTDGKKAFVEGVLVKARSARD